MEFQGEKNPRKAWLSVAYRSSLSLVDMLYIRFSLFLCSLVWGSFAETHLKKTEETQKKRRYTGTGWKPELVDKEFLSLSLSLSYTHTRTGSGVCISVSLKYRGDEPIGQNPNLDHFLDGDRGV